MPTNPENDCSPLDLQSKPGIVCFETPEENLSLERDGVEDASASCSVSKTTSSSSKLVPCLTDEGVQTFLKDYYEDFDSIFRCGKSSELIWETFFQQYYIPDVLWVRPSSNTLKGPELAHNFSQDIEGIRMELVTIENIQLLGPTAVVVFVADQEFKYRGHYQSDRAKISMVLHAKLEDGQERIRVAHEHRCAGQPIPDPAADPK